MVQVLKSIDCYLFLFVNRTFSSPLLDDFFIAITTPANWGIPIICGVLLYLVLCKNKKKAVVVLGLSLVTVAITDPLCSQILKPLFHRLRPCNPCYFVNDNHIFLPDAHFLFRYKNSFSFPSGHSMNAWGQVLFFISVYPVSGWVFIPIGIFISISRVYVGVHYPSDVLVGAIIGAIIGRSVFIIYRNYLAPLPWMGIRKQKENECADISK